jgi:hypothetical protein
MAASGALIMDGLIFGGRPMVAIEEFIKGDVYIDFPYEDVKFRYENRTGRVFRRFYGEAEKEIVPDSDLYHDAISAGKQITRDEYYADEKRDSDGSMAGSV